MCTLFVYVTLFVGRLNVSLFNFPVLELNKYMILVDVLLYSFNTHNCNLLFTYASKRVWSCPGCMYLLNQIAQWEVF